MFSNIRAARALGWTSLVVGLTELAATHWLEDEIGVKKSKSIIRGFGLREIAAGVTILSQPGLNRTLAGGLWARVAGDALDIAALAVAKQSTRNAKGLAAISAIVLAVTGADLVVASLIQHDLHHAAKIAESARQSVQHTEAHPNDGRFKGHTSSGAVEVL